MTSQKPQRGGEIRTTIRRVGIRPATDRDHDAIWEIFRTVVADRDSYAFAPDTPREIGVGYWFGAGVTSFVAEIDGRVAGMYKLISNRAALGAHVANASFMVAPDAAGRGVGRAMGEHALREARAQGYDAMQFNFVVSTNRRAVALWLSLGFRIVGSQPRAFQHGTLGLVDAYVMHRFLDDIVLTFGQQPDTRPLVRPSVYAVIVNQNREIALVAAEEGVMLPGGGIDDDEAAEEAIRREVREECALTIEIRGDLGEAIQFVHSKKRDAHFKKRSRFIAAGVVGTADNPAEHVSRWLPPHDAKKATTYESHAWAITRWVKLNT